VQVCPRSHREGPLPVLSHDASRPEKSGAYGLVLANEAEVLSRYTIETPLTHPSDLLVLDFMLVHASGYNQSRTPRWSMQFRYFNFAEPTGRCHGWAGSFASGVDFRKIHPELCKDQ
jgi:hypothetical protein